MTHLRSAVPAGLVRIAVLLAALPLCGCASPPREAAPAQWPAVWDGRQIFNTHGALVYAHSGSIADQIDSAVTAVDRDFTQRTGLAPPRGLIIVDDVEDSTIGNVDPVDLVPPEEKQGDITQLGLTPRELSLDQPLNLDNGVLTGKLGFSAEATQMVSWSVALPSQRRADQFIDHMLDAAMKQQKINLLERMLMAPLMPKFKSLFGDVLATGRDIVIYQHLCAGETAWDEARRKKETDDYAAEKMRALGLPNGPTTAPVGFPPAVSSRPASG